MNERRIREITLEANQIRVEHDVRLKAVLQKLEEECRPKRDAEHFDSIDNFHVAALAEFELDVEAQAVLNSVYDATRSNYKAALQLLRLRRQTNPPWESAAQ